MSTVKLSDQNLTDSEVNNLYSDIPDIKNQTLYNYIFCLIYNFAQIFSLLNFIQFFLFIEFDEGECPDSLFKNMEIGKEVACDENEDNAESCGNEVANDRRKDVSKKESDS